MNGPSLSHSKKSKDCYSVILHVHSEAVNVPYEKHCDYIEEVCIKKGILTQFMAFLIIRLITNCFLAMHQKLQYIISLK